MDFSLIGLSIRDKRVYEALIRTPQTSVRKLAEATGINRGSVFESIKDLRAAGLVTAILVGKRTVYRAKDPDIFHEIIAERQQQFDHAKHDVAAYVASFQGQANNPELFHFASFYEDDEGLAAILRDVLKTCRQQHIKEYHVISSASVSRYLYANFPHFTRERIKQHLFVTVLKQGVTTSGNDELSAVRQLTSTQSDTGCYTLVYGAKVALITVDQQNRASGIIIDNFHYATIQRQLFAALWDATPEA